MDTGFDKGPPDGISVSGQSLESRDWRLQLDLADGGARSWLARDSRRHELADPDGPVRPFQVIDPASGAASMFRGARAQFDPAGATLAVEVASGVRRFTIRFRVEAADACLRVRLQEAGAGAGPVELSLRLAASASRGWEAGGAGWMAAACAGFGILAAGRGVRFRPERQGVEWDGAPAVLVFQVVSGQGEARSAADSIPAAVFGDPF